MQSSEGIIGSNGRAHGSDTLFEKLCTSVQWNDANGDQNGFALCANEDQVQHSEAFTRASSLVTKSTSSTPFRRFHRMSSKERLRREESDEDMTSKHSTSCLSSRCCTKAWLYPDLPWGAPPSWRKKHMHGKHFLTVWDFIMFLSCLYVGVAVPYVISFERPEGCVFTAEGSSALWAFATFELLIDGLFLADIIINFHTARWMISSDGTPHWELIDDLRNIRAMYVTGAFFPDLLGQVPWQYMDCIAPDVDQGVKLLRLFRLFKLLRLRRLRRLLHAAYTRYPNSELVIASWQLVLTMVVGAHWMACIWYMVGRPNGWVFEEGLVDDDGRLKPGMDSYAWVTSFYWAVTTMSTIGYGDIAAVTERERMVASFVMFVGCGLFAWTTSKLTSVLTKTSICEAQFNTKMEELNEYMVARSFPKQLMAKTQSFYMLKFPTRRIWNEERLLSDLPVELRKEIHLELFRDVVGMSPLFRACSVEVRREVCHRMRPVYKEAGRRVMTAGETPGALYMVRHGRVQIESHGETLRVAERGDLFGENALLGLTEEFKRSRSATTLTLCELCMLEANDLHELLVDNIEFHQVVSRMTKRFAHWLDVAVARGQPLTQSDLLCVDWHLMSQSIEADIATQRRRQSVISVDDIRDLAVQPPTPTADRASSHGGLRGLSVGRGEHLLPGLRPAAAHAALDVAAMKPKPIRTLLTLVLHELRGVPSTDRSYSPFITVRWAGSLQHPAGEQFAETAMFQLHEGQPGEVAVDRTVTLALLHQHNNWASMPPLVITIWRLRSDQHHRLAREGTFRGDRSFGDGLRRAGSGARGLLGLLDGGRKARRQEEEAGQGGEGFDDCVKMWEGRVSLREVAEHRVDRERGANDLIVTQDAVEAKSTQGATVWLAVECRMLRVLWKSSRWLSLLSLFRAKGHRLDSKYFQESRKKAVEHVAASVWSFDKAVLRERRHRQTVKSAERLFSSGRAGQLPAKSDATSPLALGSRSPARDVSPLGVQSLSTEEQFEGVSVKGRQPSQGLQARRKQLTRRVSIEGTESAHTTSRVASSDDEISLQDGSSPTRMFQGRSWQSEFQAVDWRSASAPPGGVAGKGNGQARPENAIYFSAGSEEPGEEGKGGGQHVCVDELVSNMERICDRAVKKATATAVREIRAHMVELTQSLKGGPVSPLRNGGLEGGYNGHGLGRARSEGRDLGQNGNSRVGMSAGELRRICVVGDAGGQDDAGYLPPRSYRGQRSPKRGPIQPGPPQRRLRSLGEQRDEAVCELAPRPTLVPEEEDGAAGPVGGEHGASEEGVALTVAAEERDDGAKSERGSSAESLPDDASASSWHEEYHHVLSEHTC